MRTTGTEYLNSCRLTHSYGIDGFKGNRSNKPDEAIQEANNGPTLFLSIPFTSDNRVSLLGRDGKSLSEATGFVRVNLFNIQPGNGRRSSIVLFRKWRRQTLGRGVIMKEEAFDNPSGAIYEPSLRGHVLSSGQTTAYMSASFSLLST